MNFKEIFNNKSLRFLVVLILAVIFLFYESTESKLLDRLGNNQELIKKFDDFKLDGYENDISLPVEILESVIVLQSYLGFQTKLEELADSIDASGLIYVSINANSNLNFKMWDMARYGKIITKKAKRGDLVSFLTHMMSIECNICRYLFG